ncbi:hypothetical protein CALCODRAFT_511593 [Calocera cornea HHB12733]|uniref:RanBP2-type domain-containing protein n=1 Tax=Calocera cornea HHB12733 TaxID=1353952 RepID=A0A165DNH1_9BASI|nr:hypothetical protein CALCODRAFT_511593 [Calocera cornea HHB12733]
MNPPLALPVSPSQSQAKIDEVLNRLHRLALESGTQQQHQMSPHMYGAQMGMAQMQMGVGMGMQQYGQQYAQQQAQAQMLQQQQQQAHAQQYAQRDTDSLSSHSSLSHSHSHTFSSTTNATTSSSASSSPGAAPTQSQSHSQSQSQSQSQAGQYPGQGQGQGSGQGPMTPPLSAGAASLDMGMQSPPVGGMGMGGMSMSMGGSGAMGMGLASPTGPPGKAYSYRPGDWICVSPACSYPNFGRNEYCNACRCPRPTSGTGMGGMPRATPAPAPQLGGAGSFYASPEMAQAGGPRFGQAQAPRLQGLGVGGGGGVYGSPGAGGAGAVGLGVGVQGGGQIGLPGLAAGAGASLQSPGGVPGLVMPGASAGVGVGGTGTESARSAMIVTPSGRAFASAGSRKNVSGDDGNPVVLFWPDNEPIPDPGQVRPNMLGLSQPPILNTGNKGPIEHQPGDWYCQKCEHLNWRRRKVCQNCYRFAEGNEDDTTLARQAECISVLIAQLVAAKKAQEAGVMLNLGNMMGVPSPGAGSVSDGQITPGVKGQEGMMFAPPPAQVQVYDRQPAQRAMPLQMSASSLYTPPALAAAQAYEPSYGSSASPMLPSVLQSKALASLPSLTAGPISPNPLRINSNPNPSPNQQGHNGPASPLAPINTSPTALRAAVARRVSPPATPLDPPKSARTNIWGPASGGAASASPPSRWPDFAGGKRLTPPQGPGTPSPRGSVAESGSAESARGSFSEGSASLGGMAFTPCSAPGASAGPVGGPSATTSSVPASKSTHPRLAGLHRA